MGKRYDAKNPNTRTMKAKDTASRILKKDCRTCNNTRTVRVAKPMGRRGGEPQRYEAPREIKCPDC